MKRQAIVDWEKIFENMYPIKDLHPEYVKDSYKLPSKKWARDQNTHFTKQDIQMAYTHMKRCSTSLVTRECKQTKMRYH